MGIKGLHIILKSIQKQCHLKKFKNQTLGVDAYGWLHRGTIACALDLALNRPTTRHIEFVLNRVRMLLYFGVTPYLVFDGDNLPSKEGTESSRLKTREESKKLGNELYSKGRTAEAYQEFQKAIDVTPEMARQVIEELKRMEVQYVVAPYEADAQLVYLEHQGVINGIISEDSDLLVFGARCLLSKLDQHGDCIEINRGDFTACRDISLIGWTDADFRRMCILSGCDYLMGIPKMGLKTAYRNIRQHRNVEKVLRMLRFNGQYNIPSDYLDKFKQAELTFLYQWVFCPKAEKLVTLNPLEDGLEAEEMPFIGADVSPEIALGVACGDLNPMTKEPINLKPSMTRRFPAGTGRRQTLASTADLKPNGCIDSFLTPKRVPLIELDPNNLSPSPSQQLLLERHADSSWEASPAPVRPVTRSASSLPHTPSADGPLIRTVDKDSFLSRAARLSTFQPGKRPRLCSDADEDSANSPSKDCRSRYFMDNSESGPCGQKTTSKKSRKTAFSIFSDEIADNLITKLPDVATPVDSQAKITVNQLKSEQSPLPQVSTSAITPRVPVRDMRKSQITPPDTQSSSMATPLDQTTSSPAVSADFDPTLTEDVQEPHVNGKNSALLSKYVFQAGNAPRCPSPSVQKTEIGSLFNPNPAVPAAWESGGSRDTKQLNRPRLTALQRLGRSALIRSKSLDSMGAGPLPRESQLSERGPGSTSDRPGTRVLTLKHQGSEDLLVPHSDDEDADSGDRRAKLTSLNLQRFSFTSL
ncbi:hypothetical protein Egran_01071 [Elaphomyces granulatus]|uniref:Uncharacterized protein n=1 Tax=Elaphomyces granulatus TaxID=519963 RepID=A0A232M4A7_9EURO|nr:hypothetical protein Egran_01071 [Elaphomyces granulatus]